MKESNLHTPSSIKGRVGVDVGLRNSKLGVGSSKLGVGSMRWSKGA